MIIFDALVMQLKSADLIDVAACLLCGKWMTRIWTYQEICLAKRAMIITGNGVVEFMDMARWLRTLSGNDGNFPEGFGTDVGPLDRADPARKSEDKYDKLYLTFARLLGRTDGESPRLTQLA